MLLKKKNTKTKSLELQIKHNKVFSQDVDTMKADLERQLAICFFFISLTNKKF